MTIGAIFLRAVVVPGNQCSSHRPIAPKAGMICSAGLRYIETGRKHLRFCGMAQVLMRYFMSHYTHYLIAVRAL
jgi:hypothetical protein